MNLRENPTTQSAVVTQVDKGTPMRVLDKTEKPEIIAGDGGLVSRSIVGSNRRMGVRSFIDVQK